MKLKSLFSRSRILIAIFFYSSVVGFTSGDGSGEKTWVDLVAGIGSFTHIIKDCNGNILRHDDYPITDAGATIEHNYGIGTFIGKLGTFSITRTTSYISDKYQESPSDDLSYSSSYIGAGIGLNFPYLGIDGGILYFQNISSAHLPIQNSHYQPMAKLRIGFEDSWYFSTSFFRNTPLMVNGGLYDLGLGFKLSGSKSSAWFGFGGGPYNEGQFIARVMIAPNGWKAAVHLSGNFGLGSDGTEYGVSAGLRWNFQ